MARHLFDVGTLNALVPTLTAPSAAIYGWAGGGADTVGLVIGSGAAEMIDGNPATFGSLGLASGTQYQFLRIDLGAAVPIRSIGILAWWGRLSPASVAT